MLISSSVLHRKIFNIFKIVGLDSFWGDYFDSRFYIANLLSQKKTSSILDIGCGTGVLLHTSNAKLKVGLELSFETIKEAKKLNSGINLIQGDARYLPFKENIFETILTMHLFPVMKNLDLDWKQSVKEINRIQILNKSTIMITGANRMSKHFGKTHELNYRKSYLTYNEIADLFKKNFKIKIEGYGPHSKFVMFALKKIIYKFSDNFSEKFGLDNFLFRFLKNERYLKDGRSYIIICSNLNNFI